jgi:serine/threonine protein kinase
VRDGDIFGSRRDGGLPPAPGPESSGPESFLGRRLGDRYEILEVLGVGGMGAVFRAQHVAIERPVAVKVLLPACFRLPTVRERFFREARVANRIRHKNVLETLDLGETPEGIPYSVMDLLFGETLAERLARGTMPLPEILETTLQVCDGLGAAHDLGIIHRDVTPSNIFLVRRGTVGVGGPLVKILDFGVAFVQAEVRLTQPGQWVGTPQYIAPEVVLGQDLSIAADIYSLGVVLFEALAGRPPFEDPKPAVLATRHVTEDPPQIAELCPDVPPRFADLVMHCLEKHPDDRPPNMRVIAEDVRRVMREFGSPRRRTVPPSVHPPVPEDLDVVGSAEPASAQAPGAGIGTWVDWLGQIRARLASSRDPKALGEVRRVEETLEEITALESEWAERTAEVAEWETEGAARQLRFAQALEALSAEEVRLADALAAAVPPLERAEQRLEAARTHLAEARRQVVAAEIGGSRTISSARDAGIPMAPLDAALLQAYAAAGAAVAAYEASVAAERTCRRAKEACEGELHDVRYQIGELHRNSERDARAAAERLAAANARLDGLERRRTELFRSLIEAAGTLSACCA